MAWVPSTAPSVRSCGVGLQTLRQCLSGPIQAFTLEPATEVVGRDEVIEVPPELLVAVVVIALDGGILDGAVHPLDLAVGPGVVHLRQPMLDAVLVADAVEDVAAVPDVLLAWGELHAVVGQHGMDTVGDGLDQVAQEVGGLHLSGASDQADEGELAGAVDGHEKTELAFLGADLGDVDVE